MLAGAMVDTGSSININLDSMLNLLDQEYKLWNI